MPELAPEILCCDLLVFDLDGTLVDSQQDLASAVNASLNHMLRPSLPQERIAGFIGDGASALLLRALEATGGADGSSLEAALSFFLLYYRLHLLDATHLYPGVLAALQRIQTLAPSLPMAILTNKPVNPSRAICQGLGLSGFFFANYGGNSFATKKPDPLGMQTIMGEASLWSGRVIRPERTVLIGDSHVDVETARAAGVLSLGCSYGFDPVRLSNAYPDAMAESPSAWISGLQSMLGSGT